MTLLEQLQSATEGSRELDARVHIAMVNPSVMTNAGNWRGEEVEHKPASEVFKEGWDFREAAALMGCPDYTTNLQDAVSLVPEGAIWMVNAANMVNTCFGAGVNDSYSSASHPALALCIAIIKAHEAREEAA